MIINSNVKEFLPFSNLKNIYVVADFDKTITTGNSETSWSILASSNLVPNSYIKERDELYKYYRPIEVDEKMDLNKKVTLVREWFQKHIEFFVNEVSVKSNYEEIYEWKDIAFALDFNNKELAGLANISQFVKEIFDIEGIKKFYE